MVWSVLVSPCILDIADFDLFGKQNRGDNYKVFAYDVLVTAKISNQGAIATV